MAAAPCAPSRTGSAPAWDGRRSRPCPFTRRRTGLVCGALEPDPSLALEHSTPSSRPRKSNCQKARRYSPSVTAKTDLLLPADRRPDLSGPRSRRVRRVDLAGLAARASVLQGLRPQQAADVIRAKRRPSALHLRLCRAGDAEEAACDAAETGAASGFRTCLAADCALGRFLGFLQHEIVLDHIERPIDLLAVGRLAGFVLRRSRR